MKQKITKGKVVQHCLKVTAAIVVAGGVGFQFHEIQGLEKDLNTLNNKHTETVQELKTTTDYANQVELRNQEILLTTEKLTAKVKKLEKDKKELKKVQKQLKQAEAFAEEQKKKFQAKEKELSKQLIEERERPRTVSTSNTSSQKSSTNNVTPVTGKTEAPKTTKASTNKVVSGTASAYTASCKGCTGTTASGQKVSDGMVAMAEWVPLGTKVRITIPGYGTRVYTVSDRGGAIKGNRVDIYMDSHSDAVEFGMREVKIEILD